jgi:hypothetical protein
MGMKRLKPIVIGSLLVVSGVFVAGLGWSTVFARETMEVIRDKDKTVYVIDSDDESRREEERDKERAWQMLQNGNIWIDGRQRRPVPNPSDR